MHRRTILTAVCIGILSLRAHSADESLRIDGTTTETFRVSNAALLESLVPADRVQLVLAEQIIQAAASPKKSDDFVPLDPGAANFVPLEAVRLELNGLTYHEILQLSRSKHVKVKVGFITEPSNNATSGHDR